MAASSKLHAFWNHPAGPKTIHFWAPTFKWGLTVANVSDFAKAPEILSYPQQIALAASGLIWARYSTIVTPEFVSSDALIFIMDRVNMSIIDLKNWNLFGVSLGMSATGIYQLARKARHDYYSEKNRGKAEGIERT